MIDTPTEISCLLNRSRIPRLDYLMFRHLGPDHVEGFRVAEQVTLDFRTWRAYPQKQICLLLLEELNDRLRKIQSQYGPLVDAYEKRGFIRLAPFLGNIQAGPVSIEAISVDRGEQMAFVYVFEKPGRRVVYAPCDAKPFPEHRVEVQRPEPPCHPAWNIRDRAQTPLQIPVGSHLKDYPVHPRTNAGSSGTHRGKKNPLCSS